MQQHVCAPTERDAAASAPEACDEYSVSELPSLLFCLRRGGGPSSVPLGTLTQTCRVACAEQTT